MKISAQQLIEETRKRMEQLYEYTFYSHGTYEDGENQQQVPPAPGADPNAIPPAPGADPNAMGGMPPAPNAGDPNAMPPAPNAGDPNAMPPAPGADPNAMGGDQMGGMNLAPNAGDPNAMPTAPGADPNAMGGMPDDGMGNDNVIEISQLTDTQAQMQQAQDEQSEKLDGVDRKLTTLMTIVDKFSQALDANDAKLNDLKDELRKRTPTEEETMNVRLDAGGNPFKQKPEEFWDKFQDINNHYNITANNDAPQFQITKGDVDNVNDRLIDKELDEVPRSLKEYFIR